MSGSLAAAVGAELRERVVAWEALPEPLAAVVEEPLADLVVELAGLSAARRHGGAHPDLLSVLDADLAARTGLLPWPGALPAAAAALPALLAPGGWDAVRSTVRGLLPDGLAPRLAEAAATVLADAGRLAAVHVEEWSGLGLPAAGPGGAELVVRSGRLVVGASLVAEAAAEGGGRSESVARRYAARWLRDPAPEAALPRHRTRSAELLRDLLPAARGGPR